MAFRILRGDITKLNTEAIVSRTGGRDAAETDYETAVYRAAGYEQLLSYRQEKIGTVAVGDVFVTPGFSLPAKYIIHMVIPSGSGGEDLERILRSGYQNSLKTAKEYGISSVALQLGQAETLGYSKEEEMRIAIDEISAFLRGNEMEVVLAVLEEQTKVPDETRFPKLEEYIGRNYMETDRADGFGISFETALPEGNAASFTAGCGAPVMAPAAPQPCMAQPMQAAKPRPKPAMLADRAAAPAAKKLSIPSPLKTVFKKKKETGAHFKAGYSEDACSESAYFEEAFGGTDFGMLHESSLEERMLHTADTFSQYLLYLIQSKQMENAEVYKRAIVDKKTFSKIKNNPEYHPQKLTALCLCVGAKLNLEEAKDLLARAGYALSPCDKTDIIFSYFIENEIYDMIELDIQLEEHGLGCIIA